MSKPSKHDCQLLDVDQDGIKDCVVVGENGLMTAINPINGKLITSNITTQGATNLLLMNDVNSFIKGFCHAMNGLIKKR